MPSDIEKWNLHCHEYNILFYQSITDLDSFKNGLIFKMFTSFKVKQFYDLGLLKFRVFNIIE